MIHKAGRGVRQRGHDYERKVVKELLDMGFTAETSRSCNRKLDDAKVDIVTDAPFNIQCKCHNVFKNPLPVLEQMPDDNDINIIFQKIVHKTEIVVMSKEDFYRILTKLNKSDIL